VFADGPPEVIGHQYEDAVRIGDLGSIVAGFGSAEVLVEDLPKAELVEDSAEQENRPPGPRVEDVDVGRLVGQAGLTAQNPFELGQ
jgi:hypothetical protein